MKLTTKHFAATAAVLLLGVAGVVSVQALGSRAAPEAADAAGPTGVDVALAAVAEEPAGVRESVEQPVEEQVAPPAAVQRPVWSGRLVDEASGAPLDSSRCAPWRHAPRRSRASQRVASSARPHAL